MTFRHPRRARPIRKRTEHLWKWPSHVERLENRVLLTASGDSTSTTSDELAVAHQAALVDFHGPDLVGKDGQFSRLGFDLAYLFEQKKIHDANHIGSAFSPREIAPLQIADDRVVVDFVLRTDSPLVRAQLASIGMVNVEVVGNLFSGNLPIASLDDLAGLSSVGFARPSYQPVTSAGFVTSQADVAMRSDLASAAFNVDGSGATVGILSDSFNALRFVTGVDGVAQDIASGDLPADTTVLRDSFIGTDEGRAMAQLVHYVAPGAAIQFATGVGGETTFANNIRRLADARSTVIVDDLIYLTEPFFQDGVVARAVDDVVSRGIPYFSSAGNNGDESYQSAFNNSGVLGGLSGRPLHDFEPGVGVVTAQQFDIPVGGSTRIVLQWDQPFGSLGGFGSTSDVDISLWGANGTTLLAFAADVNIGGDPLELLAFFNDGSINVDGEEGADTSFLIRNELF
jgi:hypothetical protein